MGRVLPLAEWPGRLGEPLGQPARAAHRRRAGGAHVHRVLVIGDLRGRWILMSTTTAHPARHGRVAGFGRFVLHFFEMCMPMCIGWAVGDVIYFAVADRLGSSE